MTDLFWNTLADVAARRTRCGIHGVPILDDRCLACDLEPSFGYCCEHPDCNTDLRLTFTTESDERYCVDHWPAESSHEQRLVTTIARTIDTQGAR